MNALKDERRTLQPVERANAFQEAEPDHAHVAFAIVFLGTCAFLAAGVLWLLFR